VSEKIKPRQAATVILLRHAGPGFEVFLTRRPDAMPFLGGMYCYPGGAVTKSDSSAAILEQCTGLLPQAARKIIGAQFSPREALGFWVAAIRELFEEVGVLLAITTSGTPFSINQDGAAWLASSHAALQNNSVTFGALLKNQNLYCDLASLVYFAHWQTPAEVSTRFDTRFFVAALPDNQMPLESSYEVAQSLWLTPERAMALHERGELPMIFPTFAALRTLADFDSVESVLKEYRAVESAPMRSAKASQQR
jgi:8-oxo-dGTP pyrophosphatase MutT (NUDIX family)